MRKLTLNEVYDEFIAEKIAKGLMPETLAHYGRAYNLLDAYMRENRLKYFTRLTATDWRGYMCWLNDGRRKTVSINTYLRGTRTIVLFSKSKYSAPDFVPKFMRDTKTFKQVYSDAQLATLTKEPAVYSYTETRGWALTCLLLYSSPREKSIINIRIGDIDFNAGELSIRHLKNRDVIILPLVEEIQAVLKKYLAVREARLQALGVRDNGYLFFNRAGGKMTRFQLYDAHREYNRKRGVDKKGVHIFRNTFAKLMIRAGCDAFTLQRWMCHDDLRSTKRYIDLFSQDLAHTVRKYNPLLQISAGTGNTAK
ncbi:hypothetical protein FACS1894211_11590 [Clostridia bacterium]|nr:hypothetical protein FACS1894211_11590 [Clostridia bacterium]